MLVEVRADVFVALESRRRWFIVRGDVQPDGTIRDLEIVDEETKERVLSLEATSHSREKAEEALRAEARRRGFLPTEVPCPHCGKTLYHLAAVGPGVSAKRLDDPDLEQDERGHFMVCRSCAQRVALDATTGPTGLPAFRVSPRQ